LRTIVEISGSDFAVKRAMSSASVRECSYVYFAPSGISTCRPVEPLVFT
jgi:hypothetical protein